MSFEMRRGGKAACMTRGLLGVGERKGYYSYLWEQCQGLSPGPAGRAERIGELGRAAPGRESDLGRIARDNVCPGGRKFHYKCFTD